MKRTGRIRILPFALMILGFALMILGCFGWFSGVFQAFWAGPGVEMPLGDLQGVAVDSSGNVYCGAQFYRRVQKYDPDGQFLFSLHIDPPGGAFRIRVNENDELEVANVLTSNLYRFSPSGQMLEKRQNARHAYADFGIEGERQCRGPDGSVYRIRSALLFPSVVKTSPSGEQSTVVSVPFHKWLVMGPFPAFAFWIAAGLLLGAVEYVGKARRVSCARNLSSIGAALRAYSAHHDGQFPDDLSVLIAQNYQTTFKVYTCPNSATEPALSLEEFRTGRHCDYQYFGKKLAQGVGGYDPSKTILAGDSPENHLPFFNILFADGRVKAYRGESVEEVASTNSFYLPGYNAPVRPTSQGPELP